MTGTVVIRMHVIEAGLALQTVGGMSTDLNIHSHGLCTAVVLILKVLVNGIRYERNQIVDLVVIQTAGELKISPEALLHSGLQTLNVLRLEFEIVVVENRSEERRVGKEC